MSHVRLLDLGTVPPIRSQTVYHAVAHAMSLDTPDTIILVSPSAPYVCIGFHQDLEKEVDVEYCNERKIPICRREVGGGAVYLDEGQVFIQWIFRPGHLPADLESRFTLYAKPLVETYRALGIDAYHRPINDIHVSGKKIGGTGAAQLGIAEVVVGSLMFTFDKKAMARVLRVSSEKMRDKIFDSLEQYMTTMEESLSALPDRGNVKALYMRKCAEALNAEIMHGEWTSKEEAMASEWDARFVSSEWLCQRGALKQGGVKIHEDVRVTESTFKAPGGLIRVTARLASGRIDDLALSGDFTMLPASSLVALEQSVRGLEATRDSIVEALRRSYQKHQVETPGVTPEHFGEAIMAATQKQSAA